MNPAIATLSALWALSAAGLGWYCVTIARQITYVTLADGRRQERRIPLLFRVLLPLSHNVAPLFQRPGMAPRRQRTATRLVSAGFEGALHEDEFLSMFILLPLVLGPFWIFFVRAAVLAGGTVLLDKANGGLCIFGILWLACYPSLWLRRQIALRHKSIRRSLPFALDLLTLSVEAGMDFMTALQRNVERQKVDPLGEELIRVIREIQIGKTRRAALRDMSRRVDLAELRSVVNALVQADELGVSIGSILRIQADQMRLRRFERAEKLANEAPVKMLVPLLFFIFPAVFLILLGPIVKRFVEQAF